MRKMEFLRRNHKFWPAFENRGVYYSNMVKQKTKTAYDTPFFLNSQVNGRKMVCLPTKGKFTQPMKICISCWKNSRLQSWTNTAFNANHLIFTRQLSVRVVLKNLVCREKNTFQWVYIVVLPNFTYKFVPRKKMSQYSKKWIVARVVVNDRKFEKENR